MSDGRYMGLIGDILFDKEKNQTYVVLSSKGVPTSYYDITIQNIETGEIIKDMPFRVSGGNYSQEKLRERWELKERLPEAVYSDNKNRKVFMREKSEEAPKFFWVSDHRLTITKFNADFHLMEYAYIYTLRPYNKDYLQEYNSFEFEMEESVIKSNSVVQPFQVFEDQTIRTFSPAMYFEIEYGDAEEIIEKCFAGCDWAKNYSIVAAFEAGNDSYQVIDTTSNLSDYDYEELNNLFTKTSEPDNESDDDDNDEDDYEDSNVSPYTLFAYAARLGLIPHGKYLIHISW